MSDRTFTVTLDHIRLLERFTFDWLDEVEFGSCSSNDKRPFGNSGVPDDITELLGGERCRELWGSETPTWDQATALCIQLPAVVNAIVASSMRGKPLAAHDLDGMELTYTWRASWLAEKVGQP